MKDKLIYAHNQLMNITVKGEDVERMYKALAVLAECINAPEKDEGEDEILDTE